MGLKRTKVIRKLIKCVGSSNRLVNGTEIENLLYAPNKYTYSPIQLILFDNVYLIDNHIIKITG